MWQVFCGLIAIDRGWNAYDNLSSKEPHKIYKGCLDLVAMGVAICYIFGQANWARMLQGKPPKN